MAIVIVALPPLPIDPVGISETERSIFETINQLPDALVWVLGPVMEFGNFLAVLLLPLLVFWITKRKRVVLDLALSGVGAWLLAVSSSRRSAEDGRATSSSTSIFRANAPESGLGFVSGHAASTALATVIAAYAGPALTAIAVAILAGAVAFARIYVGAHLPLDVIGGAALGWAVGSLVHFLVLPEVLGDEDEEPPWIPPPDGFPPGPPRA